MKANAAESVKFGTNGFYLPMDGNSPMVKTKHLVQMMVLFGVIILHLLIVLVLLLEMFDGDTTTLAVVVGQIRVDILYGHRQSQMVKTLRIYKQH